MNIPKNLRTFLTTSITAPVHYVRFPDNVTFPAVRVAQIGGQRAVTHDSDGDGLKSVTVQISCFAMTYAAASTLAASIEALLDGYSGALGEIQGATCQVTNSSDLYEPDAKLFHVAVDVSVRATTD